MKIKKGDKVKILSGKDKGASEKKVLKVLKEKDKLVVEGVNVAQKHQRSKGRGEKGQIVEKPMPIHISNVAKL